MTYDTKDAATKGHAKSAPGEIRTHDGRSPSWHSLRLGPYMQRRVRSAVNPGQGDETGVGAEIRHHRNGRRPEGRPLESGGAPEGRLPNPAQDLKVAPPNPARLKVVPSNPAPPRKVARSNWLALTTGCPSASGGIAAMT